MKTFRQFAEQAAVAPTPQPTAKPTPKPKVTDASAGVDKDSYGRWKGDVVNLGQELEPEKTEVKPGKKGPDADLPAGSANPNRKKDDKIAQLSPQERSELKMIRKGLIRGDYGTGPQIEKQIRNLDMKLYGMPIVKQA